MKEIENQPRLKNLTWNQICTYIVYTYAPADLNNTVPIAVPLYWRDQESTELPKTVRLLKLCSWP